MTLREIIDIANSEAVFAVLFIVGLYSVARYVQTALRDQKEENNRREEQLFQMYREQLEASARREAELMKNLEKNTEQLGNIAETLKEVQRNLSKLEDKVDTNFMAVWKELGSKADKNELSNNAKFIDTQ